jgi:Tfp pilus assembly protein PilO
MGMSKENLVIIGSLCALGLVVLFLILPSWDSVNIDRQIITEEKSYLEQVKSFNQNIEEKNKQYKSDELERLLSVLPKEEELSPLLIQLEGLATGNSLIMESVDFSKIDKTSAAQEFQSTSWQEGVSEQNGQANPEVQAQPYKILLVSLKLSGGYGAFKNYLQSVEQNLRLMDVTSFELTNSSGIAQNLFFTVNLRVYYQ